MENGMKRTLAASCFCLIAMLVAIAIGVNEASAEVSGELRPSDDLAFSNVSDTAMGQIAESDQQEPESEEIAEVQSAEDEIESVPEPQTEPEQDYADFSYDFERYFYDYEEPEYDYTPTDGLTPEGGVNYYDGRTETYYSSNVLYHYRTDEWTLDDEGFYHDAEGRYVVAASDMEQGETFMGSKGECIVLDSGCDAGVTDYYVNW